MTKEQMKKEIEEINEDSTIEVTEYGDFYLCTPNGKISIVENTYPLFEFDRYIKAIENCELRKATEHEKCRDNGSIETVIWRNGDFESPFTPDSVYNPYLD